MTVMAISAPAGQDPAVVGVPDALVSVDRCANVEPDLPGCLFSWDSVSAQAEVFGPSCTLGEFHVDAREGYPMPTRHGLKAEFLGGEADASESFERGEE